MEAAAQRSKTLGPQWGRGFCPERQKTLHPSAPYLCVGAAFVFCKLARADSTIRRPQKKEQQKSLFSSLTICYHQNLNPYNILIFTRLNNPTTYAETELILTSDNRVYHLNLLGENIADNVIVVGDQNRVEQISQRFSNVEFKTSHREFITHTGTFNGKRVTVLSTGIGTDNIDIVLNELDAAVNINPLTRQKNATLRSLNIIRLGTSGALQEHIPVNGLVASSHGLGLDGLLNFYAGWETICENSISEAFIKHTGWQANLPYPYCVQAGGKLLQLFSESCFTGITATAPGFYGPQGRRLRLNPAMDGLNELLGSFKYGQHHISNFEMETSALYGLGKLLGHNCLTICVIIANRVRKEFTTDYTKSVELLIDSCLHKITSAE